MSKLLQYFFGKPKLVGNKEAEFNIGDTVRLHTYGRVDSAREVKVVGYDEVSGEDNIIYELENAKGTVLRSTGRCILESKLYEEVEPFGEFGYYTAAI